jgi:hypothetical protein
MFLEFCKNSKIIIFNRIRGIFIYRSSETSINMILIKRRMNV